MGHFGGREAPEAKGNVDSERFGALLELEDAAVDDQANSVAVAADADEDDAAADDDDADDDDNDVAPASVENSSGDAPVDRRGDEGCDTGPSYRSSAEEAIVDEKSAESADRL